jgi:hypothetical protein
VISQAEVVSVPVPVPVPGAGGARPEVCTALSSAPRRTPRSGIGRGNSRAAATAPLALALAQNHVY